MNEGKGALSTPYTLRQIEYKVDIVALDVYNQRGPPTALEVLGVIARSNFSPLGLFSAIFFHSPTIAD